MAPGEEIWRRRAIGAAAACALSLTLGGCEPDIDGYCQERADCTGGNDKDVEACVAYVDAGEEQADARGCGSEYSDYVQCVVDASSCDDQDLGVPCTSDAECEQYIQFGSPTCEGGQCALKQYTLKNDDACDAAARVFTACGGGGLIDDDGF